MNDENSCQKQIYKQTRTGRQTHIHTHTNERKSYKLIISNYYRLI